MTETAPGKALEFRAWQHVAIFLAACVIVISRRPDSVFHAQFYGEDGAIWFAQAYNWGPWRPFYWSYNGYLHLLPRVAAAAALLVPLQHAPLIENLVAISFEALPVNLLLSSRSSAWGTLRFRIALAAIYLVLPNTGEM
ncbi:hypothetical protein, partial [Edaphobacter sp.]|uniref:hypothetical protein n=1 Tax=Edaphobacter sp. TaxID=1934404 RepID=UPI002DC05766